MAIENYKASNANETDLLIGDTLRFEYYDGNRWDGYSKGFNKRTRRDGIFPSYKLREKYRVVDFPMFDFGCVD